MNNSTPLKKRAKIAHILHLDGAGGGPKTIINHVSYYCNLYDVTVFHGGRGKLTKVCEALGITHFRLPLDSFLKIPFGFVALVWHLKRLKPDLLYLHGQWGGPLGALAGKAAGVRRIIYVCQWPSFYTDWGPLRIMRNFVAEKIPCCLSSRVVAISEGNRYQYLFRDLVEENKLVLISNSLDLAEFPAPARVKQLREKFGWVRDQIHVVSVGRLADQKRIDWLLKSWVRVQQEIPGARLWIVGGGEDEKKLRQMSVDLGLEKTCTFLGSQPDGILFMAASDLVAMTSLYEGHANIPLEAMACGKPIVASAVDGVRESYHDGEEGFLVPAADVKAMADRIIQLAKDPALREAMGSKGLSRVKLYDKSVILRQYVSLIEEVLKEV